METYDDPENGYYMYCMYYMYYVYYIYYFVLAGWLRSIGSQIVYELDHRKPMLYVTPAEHILGKLPLVPVGDTGTIPHHLRNLRTWRPQAGCWRCMQDVVCQLVGNGVVP